MKCKVMNTVIGASVIKRGGVVAYPTETFYGIGVLATDVAALEKLYTIKKRELEKAISVLIPSLDHLSEWADKVGTREKLLIKKFWPGPVTLIFKAKKKVPDLLTGGSGTIGIRLSSDPIAQDLVTKVGEAITTTSANVAGQPPAMTHSGVLRQLGNQLDGVVSQKKLSRSLGSTIVDVTGKDIKLIREGEVSWATIESALK